MILLVSGATCYPRDAKVGHLIVPKQWANPANLGLDRCEHALDNGCFSGFDPGAFMRMLEAYQPFQRYRCRFVTAPDVVGDAASTLKLWPFWSTVIRALGWSPAFVLQDGITHERVPWSEMGTAFVGGTTKFKESQQVRSLVGYALANGIKVHWGRVNGKRRLELLLKASGDSDDVTWDGSGFSMHSNVNIPKVDEWRERIDSQPELML